MRTHCIIHWTGTGGFTCPTIMHFKYSCLARIAHQLVYVHVFFTLPRGTCKRFKQAAGSVVPSIDEADTGKHAQVAVVHNRLSCQIGPHAHVKLRTTDAIVATQRG